jgi:hypothetical protein
LPAHVRFLPHYIYELNEVCLSLAFTENFAIMRGAPLRLSLTVGQQTPRGRPRLFVIQPRASKTLTWELSQSSESCFPRCHPADSQPGSPLACTALSTAVRSAGRFASQLPRCRFPRQQDQCLQARRLLPPNRSRSLVTAFRSPATVASSRKPPFQGQRSRPATSRPPLRLLRPFGSSAPRPAAGFASGRVPHQRL